MTNLVMPILLFVIWLLMQWSLSFQDIFFGLVAVLITNVLVGDLFPTRIRIELRRVIWTLVFIPVFVWELFKANLEMAYRVIHPELPIKPGIIKVQTRLKSEWAKTFLANAITLTPGTMTVDIIGDAVYIHWIYVKTEDREKAAELIMRRFENLLALIFE